MFNLSLVLTEAILFVAAGIVGFALGWRAFASVASGARRVEQETVGQLRQALTEAQVRRARAS